MFGCLSTCYSYTRRYFTLRLYPFDHQRQHREVICTQHHFVLDYTAYQIFLASISRRWQSCQTPRIYCAWSKMHSVQITSLKHEPKSTHFGHHCCLYLQENAFTYFTGNTRPLSQTNSLSTNWNHRNPKCFDPAQRKHNRPPKKIINS